MRRPLVLISMLLSLTLLATACLGDDDGVTATAPDADADADVDVESSAVADDGEECSQGKAWPDDEEFREAVCRPYRAMLDLIGGNADGIPGWSQRITAAILNYGDDRAGSIAELDAVTAEIQAAG